MQNKKPEIIVFAGPNGSGKSTVTLLAKVIAPYINADEIKKNIQCGDMEAALLAEKLREKALEERRSFTFETVLSTRRNIRLLQKARDRGYFIRCVYVLTTDPNINIWRIFTRAAAGGHSVPKEKIISRWHKALALVPELMDISDVISIYDNSAEPVRLLKKSSHGLQVWPSSLWTEERIFRLVNKPLE